MGGEEGEMKRKRFDPLTEYLVRSINRNGGRPWIKGSPKFIAREIVLLDNFLRRRGSSRLRRLKILGGGFLVLSERLGITKIVKTAKGG